jgi:hypothetical protein
MDYSDHVLPHESAMAYACSFMSYKGIFRIGRDETIRHTHVCDAAHPPRLGLSCGPPSSGMWNPIFQSSPKEGSRIPGTLVVIRHEFLARRPPWQLQPRRRRCLAKERKPCCHTASNLEQISPGRSLGQGPKIR